MKKIITIVLLISLVIPLTSCGNKTDLTMDNYKEYLDVTTKYELGGTNYLCKNYSFAEDILGGTKRVYTDFIFNTTITGSSSNFNYKNIIFKIRVSGSYYYLTGDEKQLSHTNSSENYLTHMNNYIDNFAIEYDVQLNISGNGSYETTTSIKSLLGRGGDLLYFTSDNLINVTYEIVSISGYVEAV